MSGIDYVYLQMDSDWWGATTKTLNRNIIPVDSLSLLAAEIAQEYFDKNYFSDIDAYREIYHGLRKQHEITID